MTAVENGDADAYIAKYLPDGEQAWIRSFGDGGSDYGISAATDTFGNVYVASLVNDDSAERSSADSLLSKFAPDGKLIWAQEIASDQREQANGVALDLFGNVDVTGFTDGELGAANAGGRDLFCQATTRQEIFGGLGCRGSTGTIRPGT